jgi:DNA-binding MarR family transcriptional regulator
MITIPTHILDRTDVYATGKMILAVLHDHPYSGVVQIAFRLRMHRDTVNSTMKQMRKRGIITTTRTGAKWRHEVV